MGAVAERLLLREAAGAPVVFPAGLDGPDYLSVKFWVQQVTTGLWLNPAGNAWAGGRPAVGTSGTYDAGVWKLPFTIGIEVAADGTKTNKLAVAGGKDPSRIDEALDQARAAAGLA